MMILVIMIVKMVLVMKMIFATELLQLSVFIVAHSNLCGFF